MTLSQYYNLEVRKLGYKCWNTFCALVSEDEKNEIKKRLHRQYKEKKKCNNQ